MSRTGQDYLRQPTPDPVNQDSSGGACQEGGAEEGMYELYLCAQLCVCVLSSVCVCSALCVCACVCEGECSHI